MSQETTDLIIRTVIYGSFMFISGLVGRYLFNSRKKHDAQISHLVEERDKALDRIDTISSLVEQLRVELEVCRYTYIECYTHLITIAQIAHIMRDKVHETEPTFVMSIPEIDSLPRSLNIHIENLINRKERVDANIGNDKE